MNEVCIKGHAQQAEVHIAWRLGERRGRLRAGAEHWDFSTRSMLSQVTQKEVGK